MLAARNVQLLGEHAFRPLVQGAHSLPNKRSDIHKLCTCCVPVLTFHICPPAAAGPQGLPALSTPLPAFQASSSPRLRSSQLRGPSDLRLASPDPGSRHLYAQGWGSHGFPEPSTSWICHTHSGQAAHTACEVSYCELQCSKHAASRAMQVYYVWPWTDMKALMDYMSSNNKGSLLLRQH